MVWYIAVTAAVLVSASAALASDPIAGSWRTEGGATAAIAPCGTSFCSGDHAGKRIGTIAPSGGSTYSGTIVDPANDRSYSGSATLGGPTLKLSGCVLGGLICRSQIWTRR